ncbi:hypothetical protein [Pseudomonas sp.]|uniref:hypothetical protein n=1 Tax=Pseudomonas sp. TaxID=306 RepID=UPI003CC6C597
MLNDTQWSCALPDFLVDAQAMLNKLQECLSHLELICNDQDAADCLLRTLESLSQRACGLSLVEVTAFCQQLQQLLQVAKPRNRLEGNTLKALNACLTLLAWQLELIDPRTGQLSMDEDEQTALVRALAITIDPDQQHLPSPAGRFENQADRRAP